MNYITRNKVILGVIIILIILNISTIIQLWIINRSHTPHNPPKRDILFVEELQLTKKQKEKFNQLRQDFFEKTEKYIRKINFLKESMINELLKKKSEIDKLYKFSKDISELTYKLEEVRFTEVLKMKKLLNQEQFNKFKHVIKNPPPHKGRDHRPHRPHKREDRY